MDRNEKLEMIDEARASMRESYAMYWETKGTQFLENAAYHAAVMSALLADLD